jgi:hypothetical protein
MELFQNLSLVCLAVAVIWLLVRVKKVEDHTNTTGSGSNDAPGPSRETKELGRSTAAGH